MTEFLCWLIGQIILGDFKWSALGAVLALLGVAVWHLVTRTLQPRYAWARWASLGIFVLLFVYFGHELVDPLFHQLEDWYLTPMGPPMDLEVLWPF